MKAPGAHGQPLRGARRGATRPRAPRHRSSRRCAHPKCRQGARGCQHSRAAGPARPDTAHQRRFFGRQIACHVEAFSRAAGTGSGWLRSTASTAGCWSLGRRHCGTPCASCANLRPSRICRVTDSRNRIRTSWRGRAGGTPHRGRRQVVTVTPSTLHNENQRASWVATLTCGTDVMFRVVQHRVGAAHHWSQPDRGSLGALVEEC